MNEFDVSQVNNKTTGKVIVIKKDITPFEGFMHSPTTTNLVY